MLLVAVELVFGVLVLHRAAELLLRGGVGGVGKPFDLTR